MKTFKKLMPIIFTLAVIVMMLVISSTSASAETYSGTCGDNLTWTLDTDTDVLTIDGVGDMYDYSDTSPAPWRNKYSSVGSVVIGDCVTNIGDYAFAGKENYTMSLADVNIGNSVKSIGDGAFSYCYKLTNIVIPDSVMSIGNYAFWHCTNLISVTVGDSVTSIGNYAFAGDSYHRMNLTNINIPDSVISIGDYAFRYCRSLASINIGNSVTSIGYNAFSDCNALASITIPESVSQIGNHAFSYYMYSDWYRLDLTIKCYENSFAHIYAVNNYFEYELMHKCVFTNYISDNNCTCTDDGTKTAICDNGCGKTHTLIDENTAHGHNFTIYSYDNNATCTEDGSKTAKCDRCDITDTVTDEGSAIGHSWSEWYVVTEPDYFNEGLEERVCSVCALSETNVLTVVEYPNIFTDIKESHWFYSSVEFVVKKGYMKGMSDTAFSPNSNITREQFVLILANIAGVDTNEYKNESSGFTDVKTGQWYSGAVTWAVREGYVSGMSADKFGRGQSIQRAALARMLYSYASKNGIDVTGRADLSGFGDAKEFDKAGNAWMVEPVQWAVDAGIISGMTVNGKNCVNPKGTATRAQAARMLMQFDELIK